MGISGEQIRREQEESRRRSRLGGRRATAVQAASAELVMVVDGVEIDWLVPLIVCYSVGVGGAGLAIAVMSLALGLATSKTVKIRNLDNTANVVISRIWQRSEHRTVVSVAAPQLHLWTGWHCRGFELRGANVAIVAASRGSGEIAPPLGVAASLSGRPRLRPSLPAFALAVPNVLVAGGSAFAVVDHKYGVWLALLAISSLASSVLCFLFGGPQVLVSQATHRHGSEASSD